MKTSKANPRENRAVAVHERDLSDAEFLALYRKVDCESPADWGSEDVEARVAEILGVPPYQVALRLAHPGPRER